MNLPDLLKGRKGITKLYVGLVLVGIKLGLVFVGAKLRVVKRERKGRIPNYCYWKTVKNAHWTWVYIYMLVGPTIQ